MKRSLKISTGIVLLLAPFVLLLCGVLWYKQTFNAYRHDQTVTPYAAIAALYGKADICKHKDQLYGQWVIICPDIYRFCNQPAPNIYTFKGTDVTEDLTDACHTYMHTTKPFRMLIIPAIVMSIAAMTGGIWILVKVLKHKRT